MKNLELRDQNNVRGKWLNAWLVMLGANLLMAIAALVSGEMIEGAILLLFGAINFIITYMRLSHY